MSPDPKQAGQRVPIIGFIRQKLMGKIGGKQVINPYFSAVYVGFWRGTHIAL